MNINTSLVKDFEGRERTREIVRIRDNHSCRDCGKKWKVGERRFDIHHLNGLCGKKSRSYDKVSEIGGLITLCHKCHFNRPEHTLKKKLNVVYTTDMNEHVNLIKSIKIIKGSISTGFYIILTHEQKKERIKEQSRISQRKIRQLNKDHLDREGKLRKHWQVMTKKLATNDGIKWTDREDKIIEYSSLPLWKVALRLKRSYYSVKTRKKIISERKYIVRK